MTIIEKIVNFVKDFNNDERIDFVNFVSNKIRYKIIIDETNYIKITNTPTYIIKIHIDNNLLYQIRNSYINSNTIRVSNARRKSTFTNLHIIDIEHYMRLKKIKDILENE